MADQPEPYEPLIDVSMLSDRELFASDDSTLANVIKRLVKDRESPGGILSGFQSFIDPPAPVEEPTDG